MPTAAMQTIRVVTHPTANSAARIVGPADHRLGKGEDLAGRRRVHAFETVGYRQRVIGNGHVQRMVYDTGSDSLVYASRAII